MTARQEQRLLACIALAKMPDLPGMGRCYTYARDPRRDSDVIKRDLGTAYVAWRRQLHNDGDISSVVSVRRCPLLRLASSR